MIMVLLIIEIYISTEYNSIEIYMHTRDSKITAHDLSPTA